MSISNRSLAAQRRQLGADDHQPLIESVDKYATLDALKKDVPSDQWRICCLNRGSPMTVIAPHGGFIEPGTSAIARRVAGRRYNLFDFQGLRQHAAHEFHVTATHFRDRTLCQMLHSSNAAISIHGMGNQNTKDIWLGGLNAEFKQLVLNNLLARGFTVNADSPRYRGVNRRNIVNLACNRGVQLEISNELYADLFVARRFTSSGRKPRTTERFDALVEALRMAIEQYLSRQPAGNCQCSEIACG